MSKKHKSKSVEVVYVVPPEIKEYAAYVEQNAVEIVKRVNSQFEAERDNLRDRFLSVIKGYITPVPKHYEWCPNGCPYDHSGEIYECGVVDLNQTVNEFLENEHDGGSIATFCSGYGINYTTYGDKISYDTLEAGCTIMRNIIKQHIEEKFNVELSDEKLDDVDDECFGFDSIYGNSLAIDFFTWETPIEFTGIGDMTLTEVLQVPASKQNM